MSKGLFINLEGTEGSGKTTQLRLLTERLTSVGRPPLLVREPGGTPIGEEIRHTLQHSAQNRSMTPEAELLLINASRAQLVREVIRPALAQGRLILCDRFYHSTIAYQGYGRGLDLATVHRVIDFAVGDTRPDLTVLLFVPVTVSEARRAQRQLSTPAPRDRMEEANRDFFVRVEEGYRAVAQADPEKIAFIDATQDVDTVFASVWQAVSPLLAG